MTKGLFHKALALALILSLHTSTRSQSLSNPARLQNHQDPSAENPYRPWSNGATFLTPPNGQIVHPGEIVHFDLSVTPGRSEGFVGIVSPLGMSTEWRESAPYSFTLEIPREENYVGGGGLLIGIHPVSAFGKVHGKEEYGLGSIWVDVEENQMPTKLSWRSNGSQYGPPGFKFFAIGEEERPTIIGTFPNGDMLNVVNSTYLKLASTNAKVVSVDEKGMLTALGPGTTSIIATYTLSGQTTQVDIPASVTVSTSGLIATPFSLDFGDQQTGSVSDPREVTLTNHSIGPITIYKVEILAAAVRETNDCTSGPLPPNGTCTISIRFAPFRDGASRGLISILNNYSHQLFVPISGNGVQTAILSAPDKT